MATAPETAASSDDLVETNQHTAVSNPPEKVKSNFFF
jgi:hypothetical protein